MSTFGCTFFAFFGVWVFFLWSPIGNYEKKSCVSSDLSARFKRPRKNKLMLRVSLKLLKNWRNGSQMCSSAFLCISPFNPGWSRDHPHTVIFPDRTLKKWIFWCPNVLRNWIFWTLNAQKGRWAHLAALFLLFLFFYVVCKISSFNIWTPKHLVQVSCTELTLK